MSAVALVAPLRRENVLHFLGYRGRGAPAPRTEEALGSVLEEARALAVPRGVHRCVAPECAEGLGLKTRGGSTLALGLVTIGFELERRVTELIAMGEATRALLLDAAGSAAAEEAADDLERRIHGAGRPAGRGDGRDQVRSGAHRQGHSRRTPRRVSPGYGLWPITAQRALFDLLAHDEIEVDLLPSFLMTPRKSISFALWLVGDDGKGGVEESGGSARRSTRCALCDSINCALREETETPP